VSVANGLDHVGVATDNLDAAAAEWERLGFALTPLARHAPPAGTANRCAMLRAGYVELIAVVDPQRPSATLEKFLARYAGIHILSLAITDEQAALERLTRAGFKTEIVMSSRPANPRQPNGPQAKFARLPLTDSEPRLQLLRHLTPELVWRKRFLNHPNNATALDAVIMVADPPAVLAARLSRAAGVAVVPDPAGGYALPLAHGQVRILPPDALNSVLPDVAIPSLPFVAGIIVRTADANAAVNQLLKHRSVRTPAGRLAHAAGAAVLFNS
jgi:hypothetical protein